MLFLQRKILDELRGNLSRPEISLILGPRQAGKTTLMLKLAEELKAKNIPCAYFNLDVIEDRFSFKSQHFLLDKAEKTIGKKGVVFIDEIQRLPNAGLFLKGLYDLKPDYKFVVSGSGSLELKANIIEPMTGRKKVFSCLPLSFNEFAANKLAVEFEKVSQFLKINPYERQRLVNEYLTYGGYPRVVLAKTHLEKIEVLTEIFKSYMEKDVMLLLKVEKEAAFEILVKVLANQVGNLVNRAELASTLGITEKTVEKYLNLLEKTFIISRVRPFFRNVRKELRKSPKVYFLDLGLLQLAAGKFPTAAVQTEGSLFENACFLRLKELNLLEPIRFWRSTSGAEIDFILISPKTGEIIPIEAKLKIGKMPKLGKSLINFLVKYQPRQAYIYTQEESLIFKRTGVKIRCLPFWLPLKFKPVQLPNE